MISGGRRIAGIVLGCLFVHAAIASAQIGALPVAGKRFALIIGVEKYGPDITPISGPVADANTLSEALVSVAGFQPGNITVLASDRDPAHQPTRDNILYNLSALKSVVPKDGLILLFFAGHGLERHGRAFLLPAGIHMSTDLDYLEEQAISVDRVRNGLVKIAAQQAVVLLDACRDDPEQSMGLTPNKLTNGFIAPFEKLNEGISAYAVIYATGQGQRAYISPRTHHGYFSEALVAGLKGAQTWSSKPVTLADLVKYVQNTVPSQVRQEIGIDKKQEPWAQVYGFKAEALVLAIPAPLSVTGVRFFESSQGLPPKNMRSYGLKFPSSSRFIDYEIDVAWPSDRSFQSSKLIAKWYQEDSTEWATATLTATRPPLRDTSVVENGRGWAESSKWKAGKYRFVVSTENGIKLAESTFEILPPLRGTYLKFLQADSIPAEKDRKYATMFDRSVAKPIFYEIGVSGYTLDVPEAFTLTEKVIDDTGKAVVATERSFERGKGWSTSWHVQQIAKPAAGWTPGLYRVQLLTKSGIVFREAAFRVLDYPLEVYAVRLFEGAHNDAGNVTDRKYATEFSSQTARTVWVNVRLRGVPVDTPGNVAIIVKWYNPQNVEFYSETLHVPYAAEQEQFEINSGWGWSDVGHWGAGKYRVQVLNTDNAPLMSRMFDIKP